MRQLFRFKPTIDCFLAEVGNVPVAMPAEEQVFAIVGKAKHPDAGQITLCGEIWSGPNDGLRFWLEPGWGERISEWADPA